MHKAARRCVYLPPCPAALQIRGKDGMRAGEGHVAVSKGWLVLIDMRLAEMAAPG